MVMDVLNIQVSFMNIIINSYVWESIQKRLDKIH